MKHVLSLPEKTTTCANLSTVSDIVEIAYKISRF